MSDKCKYCDEFSAAEGCTNTRDRKRCSVWIHLQQKKREAEGLAKLKAMKQPQDEPPEDEDPHYDPLDALLEDGAPEPVNPKQAFGDQKIGSAHVPTFPIRLMSLALWLGVGKYGALNWRKNPVRVSTYISAIRRHLDAYADGETRAPDGTHHLAHVMASCAIFFDAWICRTLIDDRAWLDPEITRGAEEYLAGEKRAVDAAIEDHRRRHGGTQ